MVIISDLYAFRDCQNVSLIPGKTIDFVCTFVYFEPFCTFRSFVVLDLQQIMRPEGAIKLLAAVCQNRIRTTPF
jgi:hypothetical protein